jgi:hypothetical protein
MAKMTHDRDVAGVVAFEKICDSVQKSCNAGGRGFLQREMVLRVIEGGWCVVETAFEIVYREDGR